MADPRVFNLLTIGDSGIVLYNSHSLRQIRDVSQLRQIAAEWKQDCAEQELTAESAMELLRDAYPNNPRLPIGRPAVIRGNELIRIWHRFCRNADAELLESTAIARCNSAVTDS